MKYSNLSEFYSEVARRADTPAQKIGVDEVSRVGSQLFKLLSELPPHEVLILVGLGLQVHAARK